MAKRRSGKYEIPKMVRMFKRAAAFRNEMTSAGFTDNGGAIHSAERILNILGVMHCYSSLSHINDLRKMPKAPFSEKALAAHKAGQKVYIEHVSPLRALTRQAIDLITRGATDEEFLEFVRANFQLALLTKDEMSTLNKLNRSQIQPDRLKLAGIHLVDWSQ